VCKNFEKGAGLKVLTLNIPGLSGQRCLPSWGPRRTPCFFLISQLFDAVDYSNYYFFFFFLGGGGGFLKL
jgi:hypothetical protein